MNLQFDMPTLRPGTMLRKDGTSMRIPWLPDMRTSRGEAWVIESGPDVLRIRERGIVYRCVPVTFDQSLRIVQPGVVDFTVTGTAFGVPIPTMHRRYDLLDAGRGWLQLRAQGRPDERPSFMRVDGSNLVIDFLGPLGTNDRKTLPIIQPGAAGYLPPPSDWLVRSASSAKRAMSHVDGASGR